MRALDPDVSLPFWQQQIQIARGEDSIGKRADHGSPRVWKVLSESVPSGILSRAQPAKMS